MARKWTDDDLQTAIKCARSLRQVALSLGLCGKGGGCYDFLRGHIKRLKLDTSHFTGQGWLRGRSNSNSKKSAYNYLKKGKVVNGCVLKPKLIEEGILSYECDACGIGPEWNGKDLVLQLDHKNGDRADNRKENLRFLCPNCHSQTTNFCSRKIRKRKTPKGLPLKTRVPETRDPHWRNRPRPSARKVVRPSKTELKQMIGKMPWTVIGRKYGVSDNAVRKWAKSYEIV